MRRTQDIVLARLRLYSMRWRTPPVEPAVVGVAVGASSALMQGEAPAQPDPIGVRPHGSPTAEGSREEGSKWEGAPPTRLGQDLWLRLVGLVAALAMAGASTAVWMARPTSQADPPSSGVAPMLVAEPLGTPTPLPSPSLVVHVVGDVRRPGVVQLQAGARVADALAAAGGLKRGGRLGATNLARVLVDGERVEVGATVAAGSGGAGSVDAGAASTAVGQVDLNTATADQLDALPGVGPVTAARILAWRTEHGRFSAVDELAEVAGIGPKTLGELRPHVRV